MNKAARDYAEALDERNALRRRPPHDVFRLQNQVAATVQKLRSASQSLQAAATARVGPTKRNVTAPVTGGVYAVAGKLLVKRGADSPISRAFWSVESNGPEYLKETNGKNWIVSYGAGAGSAVRLDEHWKPGGLRR